MFQRFITASLYKTTRNLKLSRLHFLLLTRQYHYANHSDDIRKICEELEDRPIRQSHLYNSYIIGTHIQKNGKVSLMGLANNFKFTSIAVMCDMYYYGSQCIPRDLYSSHANIPEFINNQDSKFKRMYIRYIQNTQPHKVFVSKEDDYDEALLQNEQKNGIMNHREIYRSDKYIDYISLEEIYVMAKQRKCYIRSIRGVYLKNYYNDTHQYDAQSFDDYYGKNAFHKTMIRYISRNMQSTLNLRSEDSIKYQDTIILLKNCANKVAEMDANLSKILYYNFVNNTQHINGDTHINIMDLVDMYGIKSHDLLLSMYQMSKPFSTGVFDFSEDYDKANKITLDDAKKALIEHAYYIDYFYGVPIKNAFRKTKNDNQLINIKTYDDSVFNGAFYTCIMLLMKQNLLQNSIRDKRLCNFNIILSFLHNQHSRVLN